MNIDIPQHYVKRLSAMSEAEQRAWIKRCLPQDLLQIDGAFEAWAADGQMEPCAEGWRVWLMMAGRGFGKTRAGAEWIHQLAMIGNKRIALVAATIDEARAIMVEGVSGLMSVARRKRVKLRWEASTRQLHWPRGSIAQLFSGESPEGLRGPEHDFAWCAGADRPADRRVGRGRGGRRAAIEPGDRALLPGCRERGERGVRGA